MEEILFADSDILVAVKPAGIESQAARRFEPDMVSRLKRYLVVNKLCTSGKEPYISTGYPQKMGKNRWKIMWELSTGWTSRFPASWSTEGRKMPQPG